MTSSQYLTLEEFTNSSSPLPTILLPRSQALRFVELCELAEMTPSSAGFLDFINGAGSAGGGANNGAHNPPVLVTQMALLLYLGEYTHARHLWRRHRRAPPSPPESSNDGDDNASSSNDYAQLELLWNAAKYCYLWSTGGIHSLTSSRLSSSDGSTNNMLVESEEFTSENSNLPFSTLALRALQSCHSSGMEPLSTYSAELLGVFRSRVNRGLHLSFDKLDCKEFCLRLNFLESSNGNEENDGREGGIWNAFGWKKDGKYLMSDVDVVLDDDEEDIMEEIVEKEEDRIGKLMDIVMFLEGKMNA